jgi:hypothetical protein
MLAQYLDVTEDFNTNGEVYVETSNYDYCVIQFVSLFTTCPIFSTIDSGDYSVSTNNNIFDPNPDNFSQIAFTDLSDGVTYTTFSGSNGLIRAGVVGRYVRIGDGGQTANKVLVMLAKIS